jgi:hypothetical protein
MAKLSVSSTALPHPIGAVTFKLLAGTTITAGQVLYVAADGTVWPAVADTLASSAAYGIAMNGGTVGQTIVVLTSCTGPLIICASGIVVGTVYVLSGTTGDICPAADLDTGDYTSLIGVGYSATQLSVCVFSSGNLCP